jgi:hypothetical protein
MLIHDAAQLSQADLEWQPPDGGWTLDRVLHHVARWYGYAAWLDEALPEEPQARYEEAHQRFRDNLAHLLSNPPPTDTAFYRNACPEPLAKRGANGREISPFAFPATGLAWAGVSSGC